MSPSAEELRMQTLSEQEGTLSCSRKGPPSTFYHGGFQSIQYTRSPVDSWCSAPESAAIPGTSSLLLPGQESKGVLIITSPATNSISSIWTLSSNNFLDANGLPV